MALTAEQKSAILKAVRPAREGHRFAGGPDRAAVQADLRSHRAPEGAQARPPHPSRPAGPDRSSSSAVKYVAGRHRALPLADRAPGPAPLSVNEQHTAVHGSRRGGLQSSPSASRVCGPGGSIRKVGCTVRHVLGRSARARWASRRAARIFPEVTARTAACAVFGSGSRAPLFGAGSASSIDGRRRIQALLDPGIRVTTRNMINPVTARTTYVCS